MMAVSRKNELDEFTNVVFVVCHEDPSHGETSTRENDTQSDARYPILTDLWDPLGKNW